MRRCLLAAGLALVACGPVPKGQTDVSPESLIPQGDLLLAEVRAHVELHGVPESLAGTGIELPTSPLGPWRYDRIPSGENVWQLSVGDYQRDGYVLYWSSTNAEWRVDG